MILEWVSASVGAAAIGLLVAHLLRTIRQLREEATKRAEVESELRAEAARAEARERQTADCLAMMSHELRTPMSGIVGMADVLGETTLDEEQRECVETVRSSAWALLGIVNDILDLAKIEARRVELEIADFQLRTTLDDVMSLLGERAHEKGIELSRLVHPDVPAIVAGDSGRLRQVLTNLVGNAIKFTDRGDVALRVTAPQSDATGTLVRIEVRDSGVGIAPEDVERLFRPFGQVGASQRQGTGLGLAISKQLVELMGGVIGVQSEPGRGSTFWFTVRLAPAAATPAAQASPLPPARVLVLDPRARSRNALELQLASLGLRVDGVSDEVSAFDRLRRAKEQKAPYALVLLDVDLPGLTGAAFVRLVRADEALAGPAFVLLGPARRRTDAIEASELGIARHLTKPVREAQLRECLAGILTPRRPPSDLTTRRTTAPRLTALRALLAEDNLINQRVAVRALTKLGYIVEVVGDGRQAVHAATTQHFDVVLMDWQMPELDGLAAATEIRRIEGGGRRTPIVAMTANALSGMRERCVAAGMDDYVSKPVGLDTLRSVLVRWNPVASETTEEAIDRDALGRLRATLGDDELCDSVVRELVAEWPATLAALREAAASSEVTELKRRAEELTRTATLVGAVGLAELSGGLAERADCSAQLGGVFIRVEREMRRAASALAVESEPLRGVA